MQVTRYTVIVLRSFGLLFIVKFADGQQNQDKSFLGPNKWHNWLPDPLKISRLNPLKNADIIFHNQTLVNFGPDDNMPEYYTYGYRFYEPKAGGFKDHREFRDGGLIHGSLSVFEKNGARTNISYQGLPWTGWEALVETQDERPQSLTGTTATPIETSQGICTETEQISTMRMCTEESFATTSTKACSTATAATTSAEASCKASSKEASSMSTELCPKTLPEEASPSTVTLSTAASEASSEQATASPKPSSSNKATAPSNCRTKQTTATVTLQPCETAYTKHRLQMCRLYPSTRPSVRKSSKDDNEVVQTWQSVQPPVQKPAKSTWLFSAQRNPLDLEPFPMQPSEHPKHLFTTHHRGMFQRLNERFSFSTHWPPQRQLTETTAKHMKLSTRRKLYNIHQAGITESERCHRLRYRKKSHIGD